MERLSDFLNRLFDEYHRDFLLSTDPLEFVHRYQDPRDREVIALISALLAYGNVRQIRSSIQNAIDRMSSIAASPRQFIYDLQEPAFRRQAFKVFRDWVHRFNTGSDLVRLLELLARSWERHGSLGGHFLFYKNPDDFDIETALNKLIAEWRSWAKATGAAKHSSFYFFLTAPASGSCCKRWCMFLRWMGRRDALDPGLWCKESPLASTFPEGKHLRPAELIIPLDTHTGRISRYLGLTTRKNADWKAALEVTARLSECDPNDPVRYDFAISRLGILDLCRKSKNKEICSRCPLDQVCTPPPLPLRLEEAES
ncbi:MAG TPA: TIGR02757 family protein [Bdellovibrionota bacterium]|nr:TIGR02757 family protein [Bdellovibrionota bacterium]